MTSNILFFLNLSAFFVTFINCVVIHTKQGSLKGFISQSRNGRPFYSFQSIPYAEPPVGELRFQDPVPAKSWQGVKDATVESPICINQLFGHVSGHEDCLYLNVYTPKITNDTLLPVMVYIYGGHFTCCNAQSDRYGAHYFMDRDVIIITYHYRLGMFGFLSTEDEIIPGNYGLKDGIAVLQWVQKYIDDFGGDRNRVTLFGGSSGAISASLTLISPLANGLFHGIITQSGHPFDMEKPGVPRLNAWRLASSVGCDGDDIKATGKLLSCLRNIPAEELAKYIETYSIGVIMPAFPWGPVIETEKAPGAFLVDDPRKLLERKSDIPWIMGMNTDDGGMLASFVYYDPSWKESLSHDFDTNYRKHFPELFRYIHHVSAEQLDNVTEMYKTHYFGDKKISENIHGFSKMFTTLIYATGIRESVKLYKGPKYVYYYDHRNKESFANMYANTKLDIDLGIVHGDELISFYNWSSEITPVTEGVDLTVSEQMLDLWTNFAATGDPNYQDRTVWNPVEESSTMNYLHIRNGELKMKQEFLKSEFDFLDSVPVDGYF
ncbi:juvenile hormone esterase-like isoform X2 [Planococcus citri]|uniref:juvenile hormone esterase-like isoform X2 n=1 Tax=Planococcus citri TaxID=170843 RepID=UPI0031F79113